MTTSKYYGFPRSLGRWVARSPRIWRIFYDEEEDCIEALSDSEGLVRFQGTRDGIFDRVPEDPARTTRIHTEGEAPATPCSPSNASESFHAQSKQPAPSSASRTATTPIDSTLSPTATTFIPATQRQRSAHSSTLPPAASASIPSPPATAPLIESTWSPLTTTFTPTPAAAHPPTGNSPKGVPATVEVLSEERLS